MAMRMAILEHEGKRIARDTCDCNPAHFRSAIRFIREIEVDSRLLEGRSKRRQDRQVAEKARRGTPVQYRLPLLRRGGFYPFWM